MSVEQASCREVVEKLERVRQIVRHNFQIKYPNRDDANNIFLFENRTHYQRIGWNFICHHGHANYFANAIEKFGVPRQGGGFVIKLG